MCSSIGTPKNNKFSICPKWKICYFLCPKIKNLYSLVIKFINFPTPKIINFPFGTNGKLMFYGVPILKHFLVILDSLCRKLETLSFDCFSQFVAKHDKIPNPKGPRAPSQKCQKNHCKVTTGKTLDVRITQGEIISSHGLNDKSLYLELF